MKEFENKVALVIGGTRGIGNATTNALLQEGATVHIVGRNVDKIEDNPNLIKHSVNISDEQQVQELNAKIEWHKTYSCRKNRRSICYTICIKKTKHICLVF